MRIDRIQAMYRVEVKITQFPLHPNTPPEGMRLEQLFAGRAYDLPAAQARMTKLMEAEGLPYGQRTHTYNSRLAQELAKWAQQQPGGEQIHHAIFQAYFVDGINLAEVDRLVEIAQSVGLSPQSARDILDNRRFSAEVDADWHRAGEIGVTGVPTFVMGGRGVVGAQPYEALERLVHQSAPYHDEGKGAK